MTKSRQLIAALIAFVIPLHGQQPKDQTGRLTMCHFHPHDPMAAVIRGVVTDPTGSTIPKVPIYLWSPRVIHSAIAATKTDSRGCFDLSATPGAYIVTVNEDGGKTKGARTKIVLPFITVNYDVTVQPGQIDEQTIPLRLRGGGGPTVRPRP